MGVDGFMAIEIGTWTASAIAASTKAALNKSGTRNRRSLALMVSTSTTAAAGAGYLPRKRPAPRPSIAAEPSVARPTGKKMFTSNRHQHELLDGRAPFHQRQVAAGVFEQHRLVNHRQLQVRGRIVHGNAAGFGQQHDEQRRKGHDVRRIEQVPARLLRGGNDVAEVGRSRP